MTDMQSCTVLTQSNITWYRQHSSDQNKTWIAVFTLLALPGKSWWASIVSILEKINRVITALYSKALQWRHNERHGVSNHLDCSLNVVQVHIKESIKAPRHWRGIHRSPVDSPHKRPATRNASIWWCHHDIYVCMWDWDLICFVLIDGLLLIWTLGHLRSPGWPLAVVITSA